MNISAFSAVPAVMITATAALLMLILTGCASGKPATPATAPTTNLGNFSVSLAVKDLAASQAFYEKLGFRIVGGIAKANYLILQNETSTIGIFQGMFPTNTLTFNPGWDRNKQTLATFQDVRELQREFKAKGLTPTVAADESSTGPAFFMLMDPDGNPILFDQHIPAPTK